MSEDQNWATVIPAYNQPVRLQKTIENLPRQLRNLIIVIDDGSSIPLQAENVEMIRHEENRGYGAAQKSGYEFALSKGATHIALVHGDCQYDPKAYEPALPLMNEFDVALGSRFLSDNAVGMPIWRKKGNRFLTGLANFRFQSNHTDLHTGARLFSANTLSKAPLTNFSNDFRFDHQLLVWAIQNKLKISEFPIPANYEDGVSSIPPLKAIKYAAGCLLSIIAP